MLPEPGVRLAVRPHRGRVADPVLPLGAAAPPGPAGRCPRRGPRWRAPRSGVDRGQRRPGDQVGVVGVGGVEPGEADQRADLAQPLDLEHVGVEAFSRPGTPSGSRRSAKSSVGRRQLAGREDLPLGGAQVRRSRGPASVAASAPAPVALDRGPDLLVGPPRELPQRGHVGPGERAASPGSADCSKRRQCCSTLACSSLAPVGGTASADSVCGNHWLEAPTTSSLSLAPAGGRGRSRAGAGCRPRQRGQLLGSPVAEHLADVALARRSSGT